MDNDARVAMVARLAAVAAYRMRQYVQYNGHFANYRLCRIVRTVRTKLGVAFTAGDYAIYNPLSLCAEANVRGKMVTTVTVWSQSNNCDTALLVADVDFLPPA